MKNKIILALLFIVSVIVMGYLRETFFVRIKWNEAVQSGQAYPPASFTLYTFMESFTLKQLFIAKIIGTIFFSIVFWLFSLLMVTLFLNKKENYRLIHFVYFSVFTFGIVVYLMGRYLFHTQEFYEFSRFLFGFIETPLGLLILYPVLRILQTRDNANS